MHATSLGSRLGRLRRLAGALALASLGALSVAASVPSCIVQGHAVKGAQSFTVDVVKVNGKDPPTVDAPLPANKGDKNETWDVDIQATGADGKPTSFNGYVRLSARPGTVVSVLNLDTGEVAGRNVLLQGGHASARMTVTAVYGPARAWVEDLGYKPAAQGTTPKCADGKDNDGDKLIDYPTDPGCAFADDDTEEGGTFTAGTSEPVEYFLPTIRDIQGASAATPYPYEALQAKSDDPQFLVVTRISKDGFYVTDLADQGNGYNHLFAFNFSTPAGMQLCDRVTYLSGTMSEFFGFTEMNFPSYRLDQLLVGQEELCQIPEPFELTDTVIPNDVEMEKQESGLVRLTQQKDMNGMPIAGTGFLVPKKFGPGLVKDNVPQPGASNCDLNGDGKVDFANAAEGGCNTVCEGDPDCSEWNAYNSRGNYKVHRGTVVMQINTDNAGAFNPLTHGGLELVSVTGTMRNFSGGTLNWTVEVRCPDDLVCSDATCTPSIIDSKHACVNITRTIDDNDEGTN